MGTDNSQVAERLGKRAINQKVAGLIPGHAKLRSVLGQGTSPYLPRGECPCTYCKSLWMTASAKGLHVNVKHRQIPEMSRRVIKYKYTVGLCSTMTI